MGGQDEGATLFLALTVLLRLCLERLLNQCVDLGAPGVVNPDITPAMLVSCPQAAGAGVCRSSLLSLHSLDNVSACLHVFHNSLFFFFKDHMSLHCRMNRSSVFYDSCSHRAKHQ